MLLTDPVFLDLHNKFDAVIRQQGLYLAPGQNSHLDTTNQKLITPADVFTFATLQIKAHVDELSASAQVAKEITALIEDGALFYTHYQRKIQSKRWRSLLKNINGIATALFPYFFSNKFAKAEQDTLEAYNNYKNSLAWLRAKARGQAVVGQFAEKGLKLFDKSDLGKAVTSAAAGVQSIAQGRVRLGLALLCRPLTYAASVVTRKLGGADLKALNALQPPL